MRRANALDETTPIVADEFPKSGKVSNIPNFREALMPILISCVFSSMNTSQNPRRFIRRQGASRRSSAIAERRKRSLSIPARAFFRCRDDRYRRRG
jgi:hypothetical protein